MFANQFDVFNGVRQRIPRGAPICPVYGVDICHNCDCVVGLNDCLLTSLMYLMGCVNVSPGVHQSTPYTGQIGAVEEGSYNGQYHKYYNRQEIAEYVY